MDIVIELNHQGRIWVSAANGTTPEEAWVPGAADTPATLRASGLCPLEEKYTPGTWTSTVSGAGRGGAARQSDDGVISSFGVEGFTARSGAADDGHGRALAVSWGSPTFSGSSHGRPPS